MRNLLPPGWKRPKGYAHGVTAAGRLVVTAGLIGWNEQEEITTDDFVGQLRQALENTMAVLREGGAGPEHIVRMTWYIVNKKEYLGALADVGAVYRDVVGRYYPAMAVVEVSALMEDRAKVEIETTAVVPD